MEARVCFACGTAGEYKNRLTEQEEYAWVNVSRQFCISEVFGATIDELVVRGQAGVFYDLAPLSQAFTLDARFATPTDEQTGSLLSDRQRVTASLAWLAHRHGQCVPNSVV